MTLPLVELTEKQFQAQVIDLAKLLGFAHYFTYRSKNSPAGWPDLAIVRDRLVLIELKASRGKPSDAQKEWIRRLLEGGVETYLVRPRDLEALALILQARVVGGGQWSSYPAEVAHHALLSATRAEVEA